MAISAAKVGLVIDYNHDIFSCSTFFALMNYYLSTAVKGENALNIVTVYAEAVMRLHFTENLNMYALPERWNGSSEEVDPSCTGLVRVAADSGIPPSVIHEFITSPDIQEKFQADTHEKSDKFKETLNLTEVPYTVIDNQNDPSKPKVVVGGHGVEVLEEYLKGCYKQ